ncbi:MAG: quinol:electron acceptor oxidoreductase subunit ActD, partial [Sphingomicrobium sp.]
MLAEFEDQDRLLDAARATRSEGYRNLDAFTPFPVEGMSEVLRIRDHR